MKTPVFLLLLIASVGLSQSFRGGMGGQISRPVSAGGFTGVAHSVGGISLPGFGYGGYHHGYSNGGYFGRWYGRPFGSAYPIYWGLPAYPLYYDTFQGLPPQPPVQQAPVMVEQPGLGAAAPTVVINQYFGSDQPPGPESDASYRPPFPTESRSAASPPQPDGYLIALSNEKIIPVVAYLVEGDQLTYVTGDGIRNAVSMSLVDKDLSRRLNRERGVRFNLP